MKSKIAKLQLSVDNKPAVYDPKPFKEQKVQENEAQYVRSLLMSFTNLVKHQSKGNGCRCTTKSTRCRFNFQHFRSPCRSRATYKDQRTVGFSDSSIFSSTDWFFNRLSALDNVTQQKLNDLEKNAPNAFHAKNWVDNNQAHFKGKVYDPIRFCINVKDRSLADLAENPIPRAQGEVSSFKLLSFQNSLDFVRRLFLNYKKIMNL